MKKISILVAAAALMVLGATFLSSCTNNTYEDQVITLPTPKLEGFSLYGANIVYWNDSANNNYRLMIDNVALDIDAHYHEDTAIVDGVEKKYSLIATSGINYSGITPSTSDPEGERQVVFMDSEAATLNLKGKKAPLGTNALDLEEHRKDFEKENAVSVVLDTERDKYIVKFPAKKWAKYAVAAYTDEKYAALASPKSVWSYNGELPIFGSDEGELTVELPITEPGNNKIYIYVRGRFDENIDRDVYATGIETVINATPIKINGPFSAKYIDAGKTVRVEITPATLIDGEILEPENYTVYRENTKTGEFVKVDGEIAKTTKYNDEKKTVYYVEDAIADNSVDYKYHVVIKKAYVEDAPTYAKVYPENWNGDIVSAYTDGGKVIDSVTIDTNAFSQVIHDNDGVKNDVVITVSAPDGAPANREDVKMTFYYGVVDTDDKVDYTKSVELKWNDSNYIGNIANVEFGTNYYGYVEAEYTSKETGNVLKVASNIVNGVITQIAGFNDVENDVKVVKGNDLNEIYITVKDSYTVGQDSAANWNYTYSYAKIAEEYINESNVPANKISVGDYSEPAKLSMFATTANNVEADVKVPLEVGNYIVKIVKSHAKNDKVTPCVVYKTVLVDNVSANRAPKVRLSTSAVASKDKDGYDIIASETYLTKLEGVKLTLKGNANYSFYDYDTDSWVDNWFASDDEYKKELALLDQNYSGLEAEKYAKALNDLNNKYANKLAGTYVVYRQAVDISSDSIIKDNITAWKPTDLKLVIKSYTGDYAVGSWEATVTDTDVVPGVTYNYLVVGKGGLEKNYYVTSSASVYASQYYK